MKRSLVPWMLVWCWFGRSPVLAADSPCVGHGGAVRHDPASGAYVCQDGTLDKKKAKPTAAGGSHRPKKHVYKFKSHTEAGQIVAPGENPPATTLKDSR